MTDLATAVDAATALPAHPRFGVRPAHANPTAGETSWSTVVDSLDRHLAVLDQQGTILAVNCAWTRFAAENGAERPIGSGWSYLAACDAAAPDAAASAVADTIRAILAGQDVERVVEYPCHSPDAERWFSVRIAPYRGPGPGRVVVDHADVTERVLIDQELRRTNDFLTAVASNIGEGLVTVTADGRVSFINDAALELLAVRRDEVAGAVLHDIVHYRHEDGSPFPLQDCPISISRATNEPIFVEHDTFVRGDGRLLPVSYSASPFSTPDGQLGSVVVFRDVTAQRDREARLEQELEDRLWESRILRALEHDGFVLHAQPIVSLADRREVSRELLIRLRDGDDLIPPDAFLPTAERLGLVTEIDRWVVTRALDLAAGGARIAINLSALSFVDHAVIDRIAEEIVGSQVDPARFMFEITETALMLDLDSAARSVSRLRGLGCKVALDDFGTGYAGFTYLKNLPIDFLKIDREFVTGLAADDASRYVVEAVVRLAASFGLTTVAEGIETKASFELLRELGVHCGQGYWLGRPRPAADFDAGGAACAT